MRGLALSGGGFRATLFHLGVIRYLYDIGELQTITHITSVSGGSVAAAHLVLNWERYNGDTASFDSAASELIEFIKLDVRGRILRRIPLYFPLYWISVAVRRLPLIDENSLGWWTRVSTTDILRRYYSHTLFKKKKLKNLAPAKGSRRPMLYLLATNIDDGQQASFTYKGFHIGDRDYSCGLKELGLAVAASSAFPGMFPPVPFQPHSGKGKDTFRLIDGGVFDNLGVRKFWDLMDSKKVNLREIIVSDASVEFKPAPRRSLLEPLTTPIRAADILFRRVYDFEKKYAEQADEENPQCTFRFLRLLDRIDPENDPSVLITEYQDELCSVRTDLDCFTDLEIAALIRHGYSVARAKLPPASSSNGRPPDAAAAALPRSPWDPIPRSRDRLARALTNGSDDLADKVLRQLGRSANRKYRFVSHRDSATYFFASTLAAAAGLVFVLPVMLTLLEATPVPPEVEGPGRSAQASLSGFRAGDAAGRFARRYAELLWERRLAAGEGKAFASDPAGRQPVETWSTSQTAYALLKSGHLRPSDLRFLADALDDRFKPPSTRRVTDRVPAAGGWHTRPGQPHLQADPALWTLAAIGRMLQRSDIDKPTRDLLTARAAAVMTYLSGSNFIVADADDLIGFNVLANQVDLRRHSAYTTALGLLALLELRRAGLDWPAQDRDRMIDSALNWLERSYRPADGGWQSIDGDTDTEIEDDAADFQIMATMLEAYAEIGRPVPAELRAAVAEHLSRAVETFPPDSAALVWIDATDERGETMTHQISIRFLAAPWAIRLCRLWLGREAADATDTANASAVKLLNGLTAELEQRIVSDRNDLTFRSAEMLIALS
ncbi:MAG: patatin-like phospholipase family protein [Pyrinomonadaceae bacterium]